MNSIAKILKKTVERVARKQVRAETQTLRKTSGQNRKSIADLSLRVKDLERRIALLSKQVPPAALRTEDLETGTLRFSPKGFMSLRKRLELSTTECGLLIGVTSRAIGKWERGVARPRGEQLRAIAALRRIGKREARARVDELVRKQR